MATNFSFVTTRWGIVAITATMLLGCGPGNPLGRLPLSGEVTLNGEPVVLGSIQFEPTVSDGLGSGARIDNGAFSVNAQQGLPPGRYLVRIYYPESQPPAEEVVAPPGPESITAAPAGFTTARELIPPAYNVASEQYVDVAADGENRFVFHILTQ